MPKIALFYFTRARGRTPVEGSKRADRRAHMKRMKKRALAYLTIHTRWEPDARLVGKWVSTHCRPCSCMGCKKGPGRALAKIPPMPVIETMAEIQMQDEVENAGYAPRSYQLEAAWYRAQQKAIHEEELYGSWQQDWDDEDLYFDQYERDSQAYEERMSALDYALEAVWDPWEGTHEIEHIFFDHGRMQSQQIAAAMFYAA